MKKLACACAALLAAAALFAGGASDGAKSLDKPTIRLLTDATGIDDKSFNAAAWRGILAYYGDTWDNAANRGVYYDVVTAQTQDMYIPNLKQAADEGYDIIAVTGFTFADALQEVSEQYPAQNFVIVDADWLSGDNIMQFVFAEHEGSYLAGVAAALQAQKDNIVNPKFGFIGGVPGATITKFEVGFIQGVRSVLPNAQFVDYYTNDWGKPELAKSQAKNWYDSGVYAIFSAAGGSGNGTIAQAKEYRLQGKNVWAIGVDSDQYEEGIYADGQSAVLTSMIKKVETCMGYALAAVAENAFSGKVLVMNAAEDAVGISDKNLSADVVAAVDRVRLDIVSGDVTIYGTYKEALAAGAVPANLLAVDD